MKLSESVIQRYAIDGSIRRYHSLGHAQHVAQMCYELEPDVDVTVIWAALFHDAVYVPGAGSDANERCSAAVFAIDIRNCEDVDATEEQITTVKALIQNTRIEVHLSPSRIFGDLAILLDADLSSLAADYDVFTFNQDCIIIENGGEVNAENRKKCADFLKQFLTVRSSIYHTDKARELWEAKARENILKLIDENE